MHSALSTNRAWSRQTASLLLRVEGPDGRTDELYLAAGVTIGRSVANAVVLAGDESMGRTHARIEVGDDGANRLVCVEADGFLTTRGGMVRELVLEDGVEFRIGRVNFRCCSGRRPVDVSGTLCPFCELPPVDLAGEGVCQCPACSGLVLPVWLDPDDPIPLLVPAVYGAFLAERYVARGGMGMVLRGRRSRGGQPVAIKILLPSSIGDDPDMGRFDREVAMLARLRHRNVVTLLDHGLSGRFRFLVLEWIEGPSLRQLIDDARKSGSWTSFADAHQWFLEVCEGLAAIHASGLVHRDVKPSNVLIGPDGAARIADLGIARAIDTAGLSETTTGRVSGSFAYMAPEQLTSPEQVDERADLFALGVTFYELLTGLRPFGSWPAASTVNPTVPYWFDEILVRLLDPDPMFRSVEAGEIRSPYEDRAQESPAGRDGVLEPSGHGARGSWATSTSVVIRGALVGGAAGAVAAAGLGGSVVVGSLVGLLPGAIGAYLGIRPGPGPEPLS